MSLLLVICIILLLHVIWILNGVKKDLKAHAKFLNYLGVLISDIDVTTMDIRDASDAASCDKAETCIADDTMDARVRVKHASS